MIWAMIWAAADREAVVAAWLLGGVANRGAWESNGNTLLYGGTPLATRRGRLWPGVVILNVNDPNVQDHLDSYRESILRAGLKIDEVRVLGSPTYWDLIDAANSPDKMWQS